MYATIFFILLALGGAVLAWGIRRRDRLVTIIGAFLVILTFLFFWFMGFWGELLWFENLGHDDRFLIAIGARIALFLAGALVGAAFIFLLTWRPLHGNRPLRIGVVVGGAALGAFWGTANWETVLKFVYQPQTAITDPVIGQTTGFYLFSLPFYDTLQGFFLFLSILALGVVTTTYFRFDTGSGNLEPRFAQATSGQWSWLFTSMSAILVALAAGRFLARYHLLYSETGVVTGPGWTDVHVRLPVLMILTFLFLASAVALMIPALRTRLEAIAVRFGLSSSDGFSGLTLPAVIAAVIALVWFLGLGIAPGMFQSFVVEPNEITMELPYIEHNIRFTRHAFGLEKVEEREFPVSDELPPHLEEGQKFYENIRLWDWRALDAVYQQFQEIRLYYEFVDVDVDRYTIDGAYRQMMISAREMEASNLPPDSQTFVNRRFKYTHGYGITLTDVSEFTPDGLPYLLIKNIPPISMFPDLEVTQPRIYYGELSDSYVVVNSREKEFDYPSGDNNVYNRYDGQGGVPISGLWRKFIYGYKYGGVKLFFSGYPTTGSRIMFHRQIRKRVNQLAPFLQTDKDPYIVLAGGKLYWIVDAYTSSNYFPYSSSIAQMEVGPTSRLNTGVRFAKSSPFTTVNYLRNSVKAVIDAYQGTVDLYVFTPDDPLIQAWDRIYPGLLKSADRMPADLRRHVRYPTDLLLTQGLIYAKYHMTDPMVFYNQEDLWVPATEKYYNNVQPVAPYYIMWQPPDGQPDLEFILMQPFTPKNRQVMIGWIAGMCDGENYGRLLAYNFPKDKRVLGPQQVETKIDQNSYLSSQLSLWDQRGSRVIRGNVLAIPIGKTILYVEPIYLQADTAAYPELRIVAVMHQDQLSYAETFDQALRGLFQGAPQEERAFAFGRPAEPGAEPAPAPAENIDILVQSANEAFRNYLQALGNRQFDAAGQALKNLESVLTQLSALSQNRSTPSMPRQEVRPAPAAPTRPPRNSNGNG